MSLNWISDDVQSRIKPPPILITRKEETKESATIFYRLVSEVAWMSAVRPPCGGIPPDSGRRGVHRPRLRSKEEDCLYYRL